VNLCVLVRSPELNSVENDVKTKTINKPVEKEVPLLCLSLLDRESIDCLSALSGRLADLQHTKQVEIQSTKKL